MTNRKETDTRTRGRREPGTIVLLASIAIVILALCALPFMSKGNASEIGTTHVEFDVPVSDFALSDEYLFDDVETMVYASEDVILRAEPNENEDVATKTAPCLAEMTLIGTNACKYWRVSYDGETWYVDSSKITEDKTSLEAKISQKRKQHVQETIASQGTSNLIVLGDSRTVGMQMSVSSNAAFICKSSMGYSWMMSTALPQAEARMDENTVVIFNFGVNDLANASKYAQALNEFKQRHPENIVCFMSVNPVDETKALAYGYATSNASIARFNATMQSSLVDVGYIDAYNWMMTNWFSTFDGLHYTANTYTRLYDYMIANLV